MLRLLKHRFRAERLNELRHLFGLMADNDRGFLWVQRPARAHYMLDQRPPARIVQHFCQGRLQARSFSRGEDDDGDISVRHSLAILSRSSGFDNDTKGTV